MITAAPLVELRNASRHLEAHRTLADMLVIIGSAGDTGSNRRVDLYLGIIRELARKHGLRPLKLGCYYFWVSKQRLRAAIENGQMRRC